jgi:cytoskeletal protein CcmA (bactofilin family)
MQIKLSLMTEMTIVCSRELSGIGVVNKRLVITGTLILLTIIAGVRIALTREYDECRNARAVTYVDDLAPTVGEQFITFASCEQRVLDSNAPSGEMTVTLAAAAGLLCFLLYGFGSRPASQEDQALERSSKWHSANQSLLPASQTANRRAPNANATVPSLIGPTVALNGVLCSDGDFHVEGSINGGIQCTNLVIADSGKVYGDVVADRVLVSGQFSGVLHANEVILAPGSRIEGTIWQRSLRIEAGAHFNGDCRHSNAPLANVGKHLFVEPVPALQDLPEKQAAIVGG